MKLTNYNLSIKSRELLSNVTVEFRKGVISHILGKNGVGKSVFAKELMLEDNGISIIGSYSNLPEDMTLKELKKFLSKKLDVDNIEYLFDILDTSNIDERVLLKRLSDGQRQKLKIATFLLLDREIIILDEITNSLDKASSNEIYSFFNLYIRSNPQKVILNITHNLADLTCMEGDYFLFEDYNIKKYKRREELIKLYVNGGI